MILVISAAVFVSFLCNASSLWAFKRVRVAALFSAICTFSDGLGKLLTS